MADLGRYFADQNSPPAWEGCPVVIGVGAENRPSGGLEAVTAAAADISERTDFMMTVADDPDQARLWVIWNTPDEMRELTIDSAGSDPSAVPDESTASTPESAVVPTPETIAPSIFSVLTHKENIVVSGGLAVDASLPADRLLWELRRKLGEVAIGRADGLSPIYYSGLGPTTTVAPSAEPPYDVDAVRTAAENCTSLEELGISSTTMGG